MKPSEETNFVCDHLALLIKSFPRFKKVLSDAVDEIKDEVKQNSRYKSDWARIFLAIDNGIQIDTEIQTLTQIDPDRLDSMLASMVEIGALKTLPQGGKPEKARGRRKVLYMRAKD